MVGVQLWLIALIKTNGESKKFSYKNRFRINNFGQKKRKELLTDLLAG